MSREDKIYGRKWWTHEWLVLLEHLDAGRMERGEAYAASGRVSQLHHRTLSVTGQVRGSRIKPYSVELRFAAWPEERLRTLYAKLRQQPGWKQFLGAGELPAGWRAHFARADLHLVPAPDERMHFACSCPDFSWPCKHAMALCCALAERMDAEPLLMLELQGFDREALLRAAAPPPVAADPLDPGSFWGAETPELSLSPPPPEPQSPLAALGPLPGSLSRQRLLQALGPVYRQAAETLADFE